MTQPHKSQSNNNAEQPKKRKKITLKYLENSGAYYLGRFASSQENFRKVMIRRIKKSCKDHPDQSYEKCLEDLETVIQKFVKLGYLNDDVYAGMTFKAMRMQGKSETMIRQKLRQKGVPQESIEAASDRFSSSDDGEDLNTDLASALRYCQKKRFGPFSRPDKVPQDKDEVYERYQKNLARLARAGYSFDVAKKALDLDVNEAEDLISQLQHLLYTN